MKYPRDPYTLGIATQCPLCGQIQGVFLLLHEGELHLGPVMCDSCGRVAKAKNPLFLAGGYTLTDGAPVLRIATDDEVQEWPRRLLVGEEQFS